MNRQYLKFIFRGVLTSAVAALALICANPAGADAMNGGDDMRDRFKDHGVAVPIASRRGVYSVQTADGRSLAIATSMDQSPRGWILVADIDTGIVEQIECPDDVPPSPPYVSVMGSNGRLYTSQGGIFLEFDPIAREWTFQERARGAGAILTMAEGPDGTIWMGNVYQAGLHSFNPETREFSNHGRMDDRERYLQNLGFDDQGWVYAGIGTARQNLVAYHPESGERRQLADEERRGSAGSGRIWRDTDDGMLYGAVHGETFRLADGQAEPVPEYQRTRQPRPEGLTQLPDGRIVREFCFAGRRLVIEDPDGSRQTFEFDYRTAGAAIRPQAVTVGQDGKIYVNSGHPAYFACYDPETDTLDYFPDSHGQQSLTTQGRYIIGGRYTGGKLKVFDTTRPWNKSPGPDEDRPNPFRAIPSSRPDINRPIVSFAHPDGVHVMIAGMPGYGRAGGGLSIYNLETEEIQKFSHEQLIPHHSITALHALPDGNLAGSTTVAGTHGGHAVESDAMLFILDWESKQIRWKTAPVPEAGNLHLQHVGADGRWYASGPRGIFVVFDTRAGKVVHRQDRGGRIIELPDERTLMLAGSEIFEFDMDTYETLHVADAPTAIGRAVVLGDRMYFASGAHLWSYRY